MTETTDPKEQLDKLLRSDDFVDLCTIRKDFNVFNVLKLQNDEVKHSRFLGWLLTPFENHYLLDNFLKEFLKIALKEPSEYNLTKTTFSDIAFEDFSDTKVYLKKMTNEGKRMDIFIDSPSNELVCVIENKIRSQEGCNQLEDYEKYVNSHEKYKNYKHKIFIFLTPDKNYDCTNLDKNYIRLDYGKLHKVIENLLKHCKSLMDDNVRYFIENYKDMIERDIMGKKDKNIVELCKKIYDENKEAIDLIIESIDIEPDLFEKLKVKNQNI